MQNCISLLLGFSLVWTFHPTWQSVGPDQLLVEFLASICLVANLAFQYLFHVFAHILVVLYLEWARGCYSNNFSSSKILKDFQFAVSDLSLPWAWARTRTRAWVRARAIAEVQCLAKVALNPLWVVSLLELASDLDLDQALHPLLHHAQVPVHLAVESQTRPEKSSCS